MSPVCFRLFQNIFYFGFSWHSLYAPAKLWSSIIIDMAHNDNDVLKILILHFEF